MGSSRDHTVVACPGLSAADLGRQAQEARDQELVRGVQAGDPAAFVELLRLYEPYHRQRVRTLIHRRRCRPDDEPDALNMAASALWQAALRFDPVQAGQEVHCTFSSYEWRVGRAALSNFVRGLQRAESHLDHSARAADAVANAAGGDHGGDPLREVLDGERRARVARAVAALPEELQEFVRLWCLEGLSECKLSARLGMSLKTRADAEETLAGAAGQTAGGIQGGIRRRRGPAERHASDRCTGSARLRP